MRLLIVGAGGHGRVVADTAKAAGIDVYAFVDKEPQDDTVHGIPVYASLEEALEDNSYEEPNFIVAISDNEARAKTYAKMMESGLKPAIVVHPLATVSDLAYVAPGTFVAAQAVVNADASVGENVIVNTAAVIEHDCVVGSHAFIAPLAVMCGNSRIGAYTFMSANATLIPNVKVGEDCLITAGAVVTKSFKDRVRLMGMPAKSVETKSYDEVTDLIPEIRRS